MTKRRFIQCDVFSATPTKGNGLAVVLDGEGLTDAQMQDFAAWTNLAETTFLLPPTTEDADYRVRIFTPKREMPFAGHPTLGSCACWLKAGGTPKDTLTVRQECNVGMVPVHRIGDGFAFEAPPTVIKPMSQDMVDAVSRAAGVTPDRIVASAVLNNGPEWQAFLLKSADDVLRIDSARIRWPEFMGVGLIGPHDVAGIVEGKLDLGLIAPHAAGSAFDYEVRMLGPSSGMSEDPITGSLNAALAHWLDSLGKFNDRYTVSQGVCIGREGRVDVSRAANGKDVLIGGQVNFLIEGTVDL